LGVSSSVVRRRIRTAAGHLQDRAQRTGCADGAGPAASAAGAPGATSAGAQPNAAGGVAVAGAPRPDAREKDRDASAALGQDRDAAAVAEDGPRHHAATSLGELLDEPPLAAWILVTLLVLLLVTVAVVGRELRRALSVGGRLPPSRIAQRLEARRTRDRRP
jgi:hypothetical protein